RATPSRTPRATADPAAVVPTGNAPPRARASASPGPPRPGPPRAPAAPARRSRGQAPRQPPLLRSRSAPRRPPTSALDRGERELEAFLELHLRLPAELLARAGRVER